MFRDLLSKGLYKYKPGDFKSEEEKRVERKMNFNPWTTQQFNVEMDKAFIKDIEVAQTFGSVKKH